MKTSGRLATIALFVLAVMLFVATGFAAENLLVNGDFQSPITTGWTLVKPSYLIAGVYNGMDIDGPGPLGLSQVFRGNAGTYYESYQISISQNVDLVEGRTYLLFANISASAANSGTITASINGTVIDDHTFTTFVTNEEKYTTLQGTYIAPSTGTFTFRVDFWRGGYYAFGPSLYMDNISFIWQAPQRTLAVSADPAASGTISKTPDKPTYDVGETVQLRASPNFGYMFSNWSGDIGTLDPSSNPMDLVMDDHKSVTANFAPANVLVKFLSSQGAGMAGGVVEYFDGGWVNAGTTNAEGELRFNYTGIRQRLNFRLTYAGETMMKNNQNYKVAPVVFQLAGVPIRLLSSTGAGLPGGVVEMFNAGWIHLGTTNANGTVLVDLPAGYYSFRMAYEGITALKSNVSTASPIVFQTIGMKVKLEHGLVGGIPGGEVLFKTPAIDWTAFGTTGSTGEVSRELLAGVYSFSMTFQGNTEEKANINIAEANPLIFAPATGSVIEFITQQKINNVSTATNSFAFKAYTGNVVAMSGQFAVVGARSDPSRRGAVYVYQKTQTGWVLFQTLTGSVINTSWSSFGGSVAIDGDYIAVGDPGYGAGTTPYNKGQVFVFHFNGASWVEEFRIYPGLGANTWFGNAVAISGDNLVVGAYGEGTPYPSFYGAAYFYQRSGTSWTYLTKFMGTYYTYFGATVALSGNYAFVGYNGGNSVKVFEKTSGWINVATLSGDVSGAAYGFSVAVDGDRAIIGAPAETGAFTNSGAAYVYQRNAGVWSRVAKLTSPVPYLRERFATSVGISGDRAVAGTGNYLSPTASSTIGAAYLYLNSGSTWVFGEKYVASDGAAGNYFGHCVDISPSEFIVSASGANAGRGAAYIYTTNSVIIPKSGTIPAPIHSIPAEFELSDNYPNPFNPATIISFTVAEPGPAALKVFNILGQEVAKLFEGTAEPGKKYEVRFDGSGLASGMYLYRLQSGTSNAVRKMLLLK